jgi:hypothetical protein
MPNELFNAEDSIDQSDNGEQAATENQPSLFHVGEGRKYSTIDELDKAYGHANEHIGKVEEENEQLREQLSALTEKASAVERVLEALNGKKGEDNSDDQQNENQSQKPVEEVVAEVLSQREKQSTSQKNAESVRTSLAAKFGDKAAEVYAAKGKELNVDLDTLAMQSPAAVLALFGASQVPTQQAAPASQVNTSNLNNTPADGVEALKERYKRGEIKRDVYWRERWKMAGQDKT